MSTKKVNVGIIGCGSITKLRHAPEYHMNQQCKIIAFSDTNIDRAKEMADKYDTSAFSDYRDIINNPEIDAVSICTANSSHAAIAIDALKAGKHVLCEKPMAPKSHDAIAMIEAANTAERVLMPAHNQRLFAGNIKAKEIISGGELGKILTFKSVFKHKGPERWSVEKGNTWFFNKERACMGVMGDLGVHKIDLIHYFTGERISEVRAILDTLHKRTADGKLIEVEDNAIILCRTESGKLGTIDVSWTNYGPEENCTFLYFEKGVVRINCDPVNNVIVETDEGQSIIYRSGKISTNDSQVKSGVIDEFIDTILYKKQPFAASMDGYNSIAVLEACFKASGSDGIVDYEI